MLEPTVLTPQPLQLCRTSAFCLANASAEPAARISLRQPRSWLACTPSSSATDCSVRPLSSSSFTASALYSLLNVRRSLFDILDPSSLKQPHLSGVSAQAKEGQ